MPDLLDEGTMNGRPVRQLVMGEGAAELPTWDWACPGSPHKKGIDGFCSLLPPATPFRAA